MIRRGATSPVRRLGGLLGELTRRRVYQVTAVHVVLAGGALEVVDIVVSQTGLPLWTVRAFLWAAAGGLPVVVALAWIDDVTPEGVRRTAESAALLEPEPEGGRDPGTPDPNIVAVLPFENLSGAVEAEPLGAGTVVEGTVQMAGSRVRLNIRLVEARDSFRAVDPWRQLSTECLRCFYPGVLGPLRRSETCPRPIEAAERSWGLA